MCKHEIGHLQETNSGIRLTNKENYNKDVYLYKREVYQTTKIGKMWYSQFILQLQLIIDASPEKWSN
jgi:hypothetical protein